MVVALQQLTVCTLIALLLGAHRVSEVGDVTVTTQPASAASVEFDPVEISKAVGGAAGVKLYVERSAIAKRSYRVLLVAEQRMIYDVFVEMTIRSNVVFRGDISGGVAPGHPQMVTVRFDRDVRTDDGSDWEAAEIGDHGSGHLVVTKLSRIAK